MYAFGLHDAPAPPAHGVMLFGLDEHDDAVPHPSAAFAAAPPADHSLEALLGKADPVAGLPDLAPNPVVAATGAGAAPAASAHAHAQYLQPRAPQPLLASAAPSASAAAYADLLSPQSIVSGRSSTSTLPASGAVLAHDEYSSSSLEGLLSYPVPSAIDLPVSTSAQASRDAAAANAARASVAVPQLMPAEIPMASLAPARAAVATVARAVPPPRVAGKRSRPVSATTAGKQQRRNSTAAAVTAAAAESTTAAAAAAVVAAAKAAKAKEIEADESRSLTAEDTAGLSPKEIHALRRKKHNEIELRRRERMKRHFAELDALCVDIHRAEEAAARDAAEDAASQGGRKKRRRPSTAGSERKDKDSVLVSAIQQIAVYKAEIDRLRAVVAGVGHAPAGAAAPAAPAALAGASQTLMQLRLSTDGVIAEASAAATQAFDVRPAHFGRSRLAEWVHPTDVASLNRAMDRLQAGEARSHAFQFRCRTASGQYQAMRALLSGDAAGCFRIVVHWA